MVLLNSKCNKIIAESIDILYYFLYEIENRDSNIKKILHINKENFYKFFELYSIEFNNDQELEEKKNFILYELERLDNMD